jgi:hypothetical protein
MTSFIQYFSLVGAFLILLAYWGHQRGWMNARGTAYNVLNAVGAAILAYVALYPFQAGFFILECVWTGLSLVTLYKVLQDKTLQRPAN